MQKGRVGSNMALRKTTHTRRDNNCKKILAALNHKSSKLARVQRGKEALPSSSPPPGKITRLVSEVTMPYS